MTAMAQKIPKDRLVEIEGLPEGLRNDALVPWETVTRMLAGRDIEWTRRTLLAEGLPTVQVGPRRRLPRVSALLQFLKAREK
jgi:hypothetical protein